MQPHGDLLTIFHAGRQPAMGGGSDAPAHSASTISAEEVTGSHVLTVDGYTRTKKGLVAGQSFRSATFAAAGHRWCISYYPVGTCLDDADYISLFLHLEPPADAAVKAWVAFSLLDAAGEPVPTYTYFNYTANTITYEGSSSSSLGKGWRKFIRRRELERSPYLRNDSFRVRCDVTVLKETARDDAAVPAAAAAARYVAVPPPDMGRDLGRLLSSGEGADVAFEVGGETVAAHRSILAARSPALLAELFAPAAAGPGAAAVCVWVEGVDAEVFRAVLHFVYTDSLPELEDVGEAAAMAMARRMLAAADRYGLERLKLICEDKLCDDVDASTVGTALALAERHGCRGLKRACLDFLMAGSNLKAAIATGGFEHLSSSCPSVLKELLDMVVAV